MVGLVGIMRQFDRSRKKAASTGDRTWQAVQQAQSDLQHRHEQSAPIASFLQHISNEDLTRLLTGGVKHPMDIYVLHLHELVCLENTDVSDLLPASAPLSWLDQVQPYYRVILAERAEVADSTSSADIGHSEAGARSSSGPGLQAGGHTAQLSRLDRGGAALPNDPTFDVWFERLLAAAVPSRQLDAPEQALLEQVHGRRFPEIRLHVNTAARQAAAAVQAVAFTLGRDIYLGTTPSAGPAWAELLTHEATHVKQASEGRLPAPSTEGIQVSLPSDPHEREAERAGQAGRSAWESGVASSSLDDPWGLGKVEAGHPQGRALLEHIQRDLPSPDAHVPSPLLHQALTDWLARELMSRGDTLGVLADAGLLDQLGVPRPTGLDIDLHAALQDRLVALRAECAQHAAEPGPGAVQWLLERVPSPTGPELTQLGQSYAPYPSFAADAASTLAQLDGSALLPGADASSLGSSPVASDSVASDIVHRRALPSAGGAPTARPPRHARRGGRPLPDSLRTELAARLGADLDQVRLHDDRAAKQAASSLDTRAFTHGQDIYLGPAAPSLDRHEGRQLLAHELVHTVQNQQLAALEGAVDSPDAGLGSANAASTTSQPGDRSEREAARLSDQLVAGADVQVLEAPTAALAREDPPTPSTPWRTQIIAGASDTGGWTITREGSDLVVTRHDQLRNERGGVVRGEAQATIVSASTSTSVASGSTSNDSDTLAASGQVLGARASGDVDLYAQGGKYRIRAQGNAALILADGKLVVQTPEMTITVMGETLMGRVGLELSAEAVAEVRGQVGAQLTPGTDGFEAGIASELAAFAGARAGLKAFAVLKWKPAALDSFLDVAGASIGVEGWAGAAAAAKLDVNLYPTIGATFAYGAALGFGGAVRGKIELQAENTALFMLTMAGRGVAVGLESIGMTYLARALNGMVTGLYIDDAARAAVANGVHLHLSIAERCALIDRMLAGSCTNDDEQSVLTVFRDARDGGEMGQLALGVQGGVLELIDKFHGEEYGQFMALLYVNAALDDIPINDTVARELVRLNLHADMTVTEARRVVNALLDGATGNDDEQAILRILRERADFASVFTAELRQRCLSDLHGEEYDALAGFLFLHDLVGDITLDDDVARAVINQDMHLAIDDSAKLMILFDAMISGATGDADEACIVKLLTDKEAFTRGLSDEALNDALADVDGAENEDLLVALRSWDRISFTNEAYDIDDNVARKAVAAGLQTRLTTDECRKLINELLDGATGNADEQAILTILNDNRSRAANILDTTELRQRVLADMHGDAYDDALALYAIQQLLPDIEIDDNVARGVVRMNLHTSITDAGTLWDIINAMLEGATGDEDEQAILGILRDCPQVHSSLSQDRLQLLVSNIDGEEYSQLLVWGRSSGVFPTLVADWLPLDDDNARLIIDEVPLGNLNEAEIGLLIQELNSGYTGDADEARLLTLLRGRPDVLTTLDQTTIDAIISNVHGAEETELFVLLYDNNRLSVDPLHPDFDDDAARRFIELGYHQDTARWPDAACRSLFIKLMEGFAGDDDEALMIQLLRERPSSITGPEDALIDQIVAHTHGAEETELFELLYTQNNLIVDPLHADFDDNSARHFVAQGYHQNSSVWTTTACQSLLDRLMAGWAGDDDELTMMQLLRDRSDVLQALDDTTINDVIAHTHGEEESELFALLWEASRLTLPHTDFDDNAARLFVDRGFHSSMSAEQLVCLVDAMVDGSTFNEDEQHILRIFQETPVVFDQLADDRIRVILGNFDGDEWDTLLVLLYRTGKGGIDLCDPELGIDDNTARLLIDEGLHQGMNGDELNRLLDEMIAGCTGDDDEDRILTLMNDCWSTLGLSDTRIQLVLDEMDGEQHDRMLGILWDLGRLPDGVELDDDLARGIIFEGRYAGRDLPTVRGLLDALLDGATANDDERALLMLLEARSDLTSSLSDDDVQLIIDNVHGDDESRLLVFLLGAGKIQLDNASFDDNATRELVNQGLHTSLTAGQRGQLVQKLVSGACMDEDEAAILTILRSQPSELSTVLSAVSLDELIGGFQADHYYELMQLLYEQGYQVDALLDTHMNAACAEHFVNSGLCSGMSAAHRGKVVAVLVASGSSDAGRAVITLFNTDTGDIPTMVQQAGFSALQQAFPADERAEIVVLVYQHDEGMRPTILASMAATTAVKLARMRLYQDMDAGDQAMLVRCLLGGSGEGADYAFEILQYCHDQGTATQAALVSALGGEETVRGLFTGAMAEDVERLLE